MSSSGPITGRNSGIKSIGLATHNPANTMATFAFRGTRGSARSRRTVVTQSGMNAARSRKIPGGRRRANTKSNTQLDSRNPDAIPSPISQRTCDVYLTNGPFTSASCRGVSLLRVTESADPRALLAEDDVRLAALLDQTLSEAGWSTTVVHDGRAALTEALTDDRGGYDVLLLDWMLPSLDGISVCRRLRELGIHTPVLVLTARGTVPDRITGLDAGADDYLAKPFDLDELLARLRALHRRTTIGQGQPLSAGTLVLDPAARRVAREGREIELSTREFDILQLLMEHAGRVVTRYTILDEVWDGEADLRSNVIDVHIAALRSKIDRPFGTDTITTVRGTGYRVERP
jgi:two-component system OmpR family response regulator